MTFERTYTIPLRKGTALASRNRKAKKAIATVRQFVERHAKSNDIVLGQELNESIWSRGMTAPPAKVTVTILKEKDGKVYVNIAGKPVKA